MSVISQRLRTLPRELDGVTVKWEVLSRSEITRLVESTAAAERNFRRSNPRWIQHLALLKESGDWVLSPLPIVIGSDGYVLDGMHRLNADLKAGTTDHVYLVVRGWPTGLDRGVDHNRPRTTSEVMAHAHPEWGMTNRVISTIRSAIMGIAVREVKVPALLDSDIEDAYQAARRQFDTVLSLFSNGKRGANGPIRGAFVRAMFNMPEDDVVRAATIVMTGGWDGPSEPRDRNMFTLLHTMSTTKAIGSAGGRATAYAKAASALLAYGRHEVVTRLYGHDSEVLPAPPLDAIRDTAMSR